MMRVVCRNLKTIRPLRKPCPPPLRFLRPLATDATTNATAQGALQLRSYQEDCVQTVLNHIDKGERRMGVSLATGSGKTVIFTELIARVVHPTSETATQTLILVHRKELVEQAARHCKQHYPNLSIEIEMASSHASGTADITIASIMSMISGDRIEKFDASLFKLILIDECHHAVSKGYLKCLEYFGVMEQNDKSPILVGMSATMSRFDGLKLGKIMDCIVYHRDYMEMIAENWLAPCKFTTVKTSADLSGVRESRTGDFHTGDLGKAVNTPEANEVTFRSWLDKASRRKSTLIFCVDIAHVHDMCRMFRENGIDAQHITSNTLLQTRRERLAAFKKGEFQVLVNCGIFTEGTDIPNIDCVVLARPTKSKNLMVQMIGRGMRKSPGKEDCHIIDMVGSLAQGIITVPTLFGLDPDELLVEATPSELQQMADDINAKREAELEAAHAAAESEANGEDAESETDGEDTGLGDDEPRELNITFTDYDSVFDLLADQRESEHIRRLSQFNWVTIELEKYILPLKKSNYLKIEKEEDGTYTVTESMRIALEPAVGRFVSTSRKVITGGESLSAVIQGADTLAAKRQAREILLHYAPWRSKQVTNAQLKFLEKFKDKFGIDDTLTAGKAGDMITRIKHGGLKRFSNLQREKRKEERLKARDEKLRIKEEAREEKRKAELQKLRNKEEVKVGRLVA